MADADLEVVPGLLRVRRPSVHLYFSGESGGGDRSWALIDAGLPGFENHLIEAAAEWFGPDSRPAAIILTHGRFDHAGAPPDLAHRWDVPVYAHAVEHPHLDGEPSLLPPPRPVGGGAMSPISRFHPRGPIDLGNRPRTLPAGGTVPETPGWRWTHAPGHAPGRVSPFRDSDRTLIVGDAFATAKRESAIDSSLRWRARVRLEGGGPLGCDTLRSPPGDGRHGARPPDAGDGIAPRVGSERMRYGR